MVVAVNQGPAQISLTVAGGRRIAAASDHRVAVDDHEVRTRQAIQELRELDALFRQEIRRGVAVEGGQARLAVGLEGRQLVEVRREERERLDVLADVSCT